MKQMRGAAGVMAALLVAGAPPLFLANAAERAFMMTDFDRIEVSGDMAVTVVLGRAPSIRASGNQRALDRLNVDVRGKVLRIRPLAGGWGGWPGERPPPPQIRIVVPELRGAYAEGASQISVAQLKGSDVRVGQSGSATVTIGRITADKLAIDQRGSGLVTLQGKAHTARVFVTGSGKLEAAGLETVVLDLTTSSSGTVAMASSKTALIKASGAGSVIVSGKPACTVRATGSGEVQCGEEAPALFGGNQ
jgi:Putative auto-transporter adhesin, head GIN domain